MSESQDIRAWARTQGIDIENRGRIPAGIREQYEARNGDGDSADLPDLDGDDLDLMPPAPQAAPAAPSAPPVDGKVVTPERRPQAPRKPRRRLFGERKPRDRKAHKRVSIEELVSGGWAMASMAISQLGTGRGLPVARVLNMQAPVAGVIVDDMARGTMLDKVLQPLARAEEKSRKAFALVGPPLLVGIVTAQPEAFPVVRPVLKASLMSWVMISKPAMEKAEKRAAAFAEEFGEIDLDGMIDALFADQIVTAPSAQEEANIRKARGG